MNIINLDDLRARIHEVGLGHHAEALLSVAAPAIRLTTHEVKEDTPLGSTKLGGLPDLPPGVAWPVVDGVLLEFVGQFRLADLTPYDAEGRLPQSGMLYFFFDGILTGYEYGETKDRRAVARDRRLDRFSSCRCAVMTGPGAPATRTACSFCIRATFETRS